jgi:hypothetical protein
MLVACSDSGAPDLDGPDFFEITLDGQPWGPDTATGVFYFTHPDTGTLNLFATGVGPTTTGTIALSIRLPLRSRVLPLADTGSAAVGTYLPGQPPGSPLPVRPLVYWSTAVSPGTLRISGFSATDTVIAGTFSFQAAAIPDTAGHHTVTGRFRVRYFTQQVYVPLQ